MLGMRRTLFVVPRELVPVVHHACARTIATRERRRVEQMVAASGISTRPAAWVRRDGNRTPRDRRAQRGLHVGRRMPSPCSRSASAQERDEVRDHAERGLAHPPAARDGGKADTRAHAAPGRTVSTAGCARRTGWTRGSSRSTWRPPGRSSSGGGSRRSAPVPRPTCAGGRVGPPVIRALLGCAARGRGSRRVDVAVLADDLERTAALEPWAALLPMLDPTTMGWNTSGTGTWAPRVRAVRQQRQCRPDRVVGRSRRRWVVAAP